MPRDGATFRQLATLPRKSPARPSFFHARESSAHMEVHSPPRHARSPASVTEGAKAQGGWPQSAAWSAELFGSA